MEGVPQPIFKFKGKYFYEASDIANTLEIKKGATSIYSLFVGSTLDDSNRTSYDDFDDEAHNKICYFRKNVAVY